MNGDTQIKRPASCATDEVQEFARVVREGFRGSDDGLQGRIVSAKLLAFHYAADGSLAAVAAPKAPGERLRRDVFARASVFASQAEFEAELGWVYVVLSISDFGRHMPAVAGR